MDLNEARNVLARESRSGSLHRQTSYAADVVLSGLRTTLRQADEYAREADALRKECARLIGRATELKSRVAELEAAQDEAGDLESFGELSDQADATDAELERVRPIMAAARDAARSWDAGTWNTGPIGTQHMTALVQAFDESAPLVDRHVESPGRDSARGLDEVFDHRASRHKESQMAWKKKSEVTPGLGQDIRNYTVDQLQARAEEKTAAGGGNAAKQLTDEIARRARLHDERD